MKSIGVEGGNESLGVLVCLYRCTRESFPMSTSFVVLELASATSSTGHRPSGQQSSTRRRYRSGVPFAIGLRSGVHNFQQIGASAPHTKRTRLQQSLGCVFWRTRTVFINRNMQFGTQLCPVTAFACLSFGNCSRAAGPTLADRSTCAEFQRATSFSQISGVQGHLRLRPSRECPGDLYGCRGPRFPLRGHRDWNAI